MKFIKPDKQKAFELKIKRFYMDGYKVEWTCPKCGYLNVRDFGDDYLSYPVVNDTEKIYLCCDNWDERCEEEFYLKGGIKIDLVIEDKLYEEES